MVVLGCMGEDPPRYGRSPFPPTGGRRGIENVWMYRYDDGIHVGLFWDLRRRYAVAVKKKRE